MSRQHGLHDYGFVKTCDGWEYSDGKRRITVKKEAGDWWNIRLDFGNDRWTAWDTPDALMEISALGCLVHVPFDDSYDL